MSNLKLFLFCFSAFLSCFLFFSDFSQNSTPAFCCEQQHPVHHSSGSSHSLSCLSHLFYHSLFWGFLFFSKAHSQPNAIFLIYCLNESFIIPSSGCFLPLAVDLNLFSQNSLVSSLTLSACKNNHFHKTCIFNIIIVENKDRYQKLCVIYFNLSQSNRSMRNIKIDCSQTDLQKCQSVSKKRMPGCEHHRVCSKVCSENKDVLYTGEEHLEKVL